MDYRQQIDVRRQIRGSQLGGTRPGGRIPHAGKYRRPEDSPKNNKLLRKVFSWLFQIVFVILLAYVLVYCFAQIRTNAGQSMETTLSSGDTVLLNSIVYQLGSPKRGDVISFRPGGSSSGQSSIKRVVGLPGETIQIVDGSLQIDGKTYLEDKDYPAMNSAGLAGEPITLDDNEYFVLGDNRNNSTDSRSADIGLVTTDMIEGKVWVVISPGEHRGLVS